MNNEAFIQVEAGQASRLADGGIAPRLVRKRVLATANSVSTRTCDNWLDHGCPHVKVSARLTLFDLDEVEEWLKRQYGTRRRGPVKPKATDPTEGSTDTQA